MNKVLVEINVPAADKVFDMYIPTDSKGHEVIKLIMAIVNDLSEKRYHATSDSLLIDVENKKILDINLVVSELTIKNGAKLMLI